MNCLHPVRIKDPSGRSKEILVPCGKCELCLKRRADLWADRMRVEASQHDYVFFVTLTYSDDFVPQFRPEDTLEYSFFTDKQRDDVFNFVTTNDVSENYLVLRYKDIQNFIKRLRKYVSEFSLCSEEQRTFRYVCVGEYGETTYRPHYHLILYVDSKELCERRVRKFRDGTTRSYPSPFEMFVRKAWQVPSGRYSKNGRPLRVPLGRIDFQVVRDDAARYVSGYVTSYSFIPSLLRVSAFRPFIQASKCPVIGSFGLDKETAKKIIVEGLNVVPNIFGNVADKNDFVYLWKSLKDRLFPKLPNYSSFSYADRCLLYGVASQPWKDCSYTEFLDYLFNYDSSDFVDRLRDLVCKSLKCDDFELLRVASQANHPLARSLVRLWRVSSLVAFNCSIYNFELDEYVSFIDSFYSRSERCGLLNQLKFEEQFSLSGDCRYLLSYVDPLARDNMSIDSWEQCKASFGFGGDEDICDFDFYSLPENRVKFENDIHYVNVGKSYKRKMDVVIHSGLTNFYNL